MLYYKRVNVLDVKCSVFMMANKLFEEKTFTCEGVGCEMFSFYDDEQII